MYCLQCGNQCERFYEGVCADCHYRNQAALDTHNAECDMWLKLTPRGRNIRIRDATLNT